MGAKSRESGYFNVKACIGRQCAVRDQRCHECVMIQGKPSEFVSVDLHRLNERGAVCGC
jgi:hypothetical protein